MLVEATTEEVVSAQSSTSTQPATSRTGANGTYRGPVAARLRLPSPPRPAPAPDRAVLAVPAHPRREDARVDGGEDLGGQPVEPDVGRAVAGRPVAVELGLLGLRQHIEAEAEVGLVGQVVHRGRVAVDRQLERGLDLEVLQSR